VVLSSREIISYGIYKVPMRLEEFSKENHELALDLPKLA
jgi:hypothetical protein